MANFQSFWCGFCSRRFYTYYFITILCVFSFSCFYAQFVYPSEYSLLYNHVSNLGSPLKNPTGAWLWNITVVFMGIALIPVAFFLIGSFSISLQTRILERSALISILVACTGFLGVGFFPDDLGSIHVVFGTCTFFGFIFALNFLYSLILWERKFHGKWRLSIFFLGILFFILNFNFLTALFIPIIATSLHLIPPIPPWFQFPLWEWVLLINIFFCFLILVLYAPYRPSKIVVST